MPEARLDAGEGTGRQPGRETGLTRRHTEARLPDEGNRLSMTREQLADAYISAWLDGWEGACDACKEAPVDLVKKVGRRMAEANR